MKRDRSPRTEQSGQSSFDSVLGLTPERWESIVVVVLLVTVLPSLFRSRNRRHEDLSAAMQNPPKPRPVTPTPEIAATVDDAASQDAPAPLLTPIPSPAAEAPVPEATLPTAPAAGKPQGSASRYGFGLTAGQWQTITLALILAAALLATTLPHV